VSRIGSRSWSTWTSTSTTLDAAVEWAIECGARLADFQPQSDVRVLFDPAGHPFCLFV
jgi:hypothetical protein